MTMDALVPLIASIGWLVLVGSALASYRLGWSRLVKLGLLWLVIFLGLFVIVGWFEVAQVTAGSLL